MTNLKNELWLKDEALQKLLKILETGGEEAKVVGGAVRNALLERPIADIDIASTRLPQETQNLLQSHKIKTIPTGIEHGTITAVVEGKPFEITTLRADFDHNGRHATVKFGRDWAQDAKRRDFTINAIYADRNGNLFDPENGLDDIKERYIRFIGSADKRIEEDHLRILRFFRIYAHYGEGKPDAEALKACARAKDKITELSAERIWAETKKMLSAKDIGKAIQWIRVTKILDVILPESQKWGISAIPHLMEIERQYAWASDPFIRLMAMIPPRLERITSLIERLKLSNKEALRLHRWVHFQDLPLPLDRAELNKTLYLNDQQAILDCYRLELVRTQNAGEVFSPMLPKMIEFIENWQSPIFPISGKDLIAHGVETGEIMGQILKTLEAYWLENNFAPSRNDLLNQLKAIKSH